MSDGSDPYLYPGTNVLKNVPGLRNAELAAFEAVNTAVRIYELLQNPIAGGLDTVHLKAIHKRVSQMLEPEAKRIFGSLHRAKLLRGLPG